jgi:hypothetical protein
MNLVDRAKNMILSPQSEWEVVNLETTTTAELYKGYIVLLAAIGPIAIFLGSVVFGVRIPYFGVSHFGLLAALSTAIVSYVCALIGVFLMALIIDALAPTFGGQKNQMQALKVTAFSFTPAWVAAVFHVIPMLGVLALLASLYSLYVLYLGLPVLMKTSKEKAVGYTVVAVLCAGVIFIVFGTVAGMVGGLALWSSGSSYSYSNGGSGSVNIDAPRQLSVNIDAANKNMEAARLSGNPQAQVNAAGAAMATMMSGNGAAVEPVDQNLLKAMLPDAVANLKRNKLEAEKVGMGNFKISKADAGYAGDAGQSIDITITDSGGASMFAGLAAWSMIEQEKETDDGYEKMGKVDGRPVHEKFNTKSKDGEYSVVVASRFIVDAHGRQVDMDTLKQSVAAIGLDKLDAMKSVGVKQ